MVDQKELLNQLELEDNLKDESRITSKPIRKIK